ncbi:MAG: class I SAM-dependent methyltransferase [Candidatus Micrarchaeota archaeon]
MAKLHQLAWERDYFKRGGLWRGASGFTPKLKPKSRVLELGCGNGKNLSSLVKQEYVVYAIDSSKTAVNLSKKLLKLMKTKAFLSVQDCCKTSFKNNFFDAVIAFHVLGHLNEKERARSIKEIKRVLKPNGLVFFKEFGLRDMRYGKGKKVEENTFERGNGIWYHYFSDKEVKKLFKEFKTETLGVESWNVFFHSKPYYRQEVLAVLKK